jgi:hypothetical protein
MIGGGGHDKQKRDRDRDDCGEMQSLFLCRKIATEAAIENRNELKSE